MSPIEKSSKLDNVCYDIRGPVLKEAKRLEEEGKSFVDSEIDYKEFTPLCKIFFCSPFKTKRGGSTLFRADFHGREWQ